MSPYETVLLDVDGTLVDSNGAHARAWVHVFRNHGFEVDPERVRTLIGKGGELIVQDAADLVAHWDESPLGRKTQ